ncbi:TetR/AcrR family transcriptional regulator [Nonomuraea sp. NEAU-A123]|uniref:TetR/AcrR family transcriptional regulator n=1 Tax=Nonomuraea sp. NEAU-A123 TaxID=2839649 RepID=UPI001BE4213B|nr:TetR/AcrR family transcriptional regulator [Nonomuraea sp. NEAU-A123]MBT2232632.1 TetR family transcriptional regulator [Nonomuraea sp. NEAU-A123]
MPTNVNHEERRHQIAEAVVRIAASRGLQAASMREVAAEAGVSLRLVQYYFHTKQELLSSVLAYLGEQLGRRMTRAVAAHGEPASPRTFLYAALTALLPTDEESRRIVLAYTAHFTLALTDSDQAAAGLSYANALRDLVAQRFGQAEVSGHPGAKAAVALALVSGLQLSVLAGQYTGEEAVALLTAHLDEAFR